MASLTEKEIAIIEIAVNMTLDRLRVNPKYYSEYVTQNFAVTILGISRKKLKQQMLDGHIHTKFDGTRWKVKREDVELFVNSISKHRPK
ncbi:MAG TPA: hypothetical protein VK213_14335 [Bacteroidales bacterium]|nr:hypothetical protein [Bacteroidales bacterium]